MNLCEVSPAEATSRAASVLLVDDEEALLEMFAEILESHFSVATARNAAEADAWLQRQAFKVIVADHSMPGETGLELLSRARVTFPHMQRVLVTGNMTTEMLCRAREGELLFAFLVKPISILEFLHVVQSAATMHDTSLAATQ